MENIEKNKTNENKKEIVLTGDRPTGNLHIGHYVGSLKNRVEMQNSGKYEMYIMIADVQALTDNFDNVEKVKTHILEVMLDYLAVGLDPSKSNIFLQSSIPALFELPMYYSNLVTQARLERNPTVKAEIKQKAFGKSIPVGFVNYPISQTADITAFNAKYVPVGDDQLPMIEQAREVVESFNRIYGETLVLPEAKLPDNKSCHRLMGTDGNAKMGKSLGNCIYLKDEPEVIEKKIMGMYTDPNHINVSDKGNTKNNPVFVYLEAFSEDKHFEMFCPEYANLNEMKAHYERGGLGDVKVKRFLNNVMQEVLKPIRERRKYYEQNLDEVIAYLEQGSQKAIEVSNKTLNKVRNAIGVNFFERVKK